MGSVISSTVNLEEVTQDSPEWADIQEFISQSSEKYTQHYHFDLEVVKLYRIPSNEVFEQFQMLSAELGEPTKLFHGTSTESAKNIINEGFKLPVWSGMFGKGVYFADCPLKSVQFALGIRRTKLTSISDIVSKFRFGGRVGTMLLCDVYLGNQLTMWQSCNGYTAEDLSRGYLPKLFGARDYDSIYAPGGSGCAVNVPEHVVFQPHQAVPRYLIEFTQRQDEF
eukprot:TRINITY_DN440_c0_g2_i1.p1 TRINITY_DN440_c0_g2~~TRINITY_DN440_c0_g2_i1.p1  ORF type:complete len:224 (+),score=26.61 TRINITY_DN440_c0_g2_i1:175-846(+)